jgi:hypothetical protein
MSGSAPAKPPYRSGPPVAPPVAVDWAGPQSTQTQGIAAEVIAHLVVELDQRIEFTGKTADVAMHARRVFYGEG